MVKEQLGGSLLIVFDIFHDLGGLVVPQPPAPSRPYLAWTPSCQGTIKVNVNDSFSSASMSSDIVGVFKYHKGNFLLYFGKQVMVDSVIQAKILAIREALLIAAASRWATTTTFVIESNSG